MRHLAFSTYQSRHWGWFRDMHALQPLIFYRPLTFFSGIRILSNGAFGGTGFGGTGLGRGGGGGVRRLLLLIHFPRFINHLYLLKPLNSNFGFLKLCIKGSKALFKDRLNIIVVLLFEPQRTELCILKMISMFLL